ncbi:hypothetical protein ACFO8O_15445 [Hephaestia sp. GCM10023244]|uniref:hypothetical protein n=1 Tax=unclassified Hephaestia TaxID=2631281 RepID=UPI0020772F3D|nr:hypothetical protein [Hephaestia sp. MAHUQ-44]MCM8732359.1 hypothetical protein [Hephaestia sp. MAHUQ-44]
MLIDEGEPFMVKQAIHVPTEFATATSPEIAYALKRADEERARALDSDNIWARAAHHELARAYERRVWRYDPQLFSSARLSG